MSFFIFSAVPTGTVDLSTIILYSFIACAIDFATERTYFKSVEPSVSEGVPTAIKHTFEALTALLISEENESLFSFRFVFTSSANPGS